MPTSTFSGGLRSGGSTFLGGSGFFSGSGLGSGLSGRGFSSWICGLTGAGSGSGSGSSGLGTGRVLTGGWMAGPASSVPAHSSTWTGAAGLVCHCTPTYSSTPISPCTAMARPRERARCSSRGTMLFIVPA
ncbi:hypothetical protein FNU76_11655 [Chitinimonas arctica]|uniref:Uncharacterized protein n=1 Tax=Chitinimonas arctica TaxID=2594795 RepID=A0A516SFM8_9NEIS|nr:hypothetical protein FNU76_11655 [Chitinimonas arctica]